MTPRERERKAKSKKRRRARIKNAGGHDLTEAQWLEIKQAWEDLCAYCQQASPSLQRDCVVPIARGGRYTLTNVVPACPTCNGSKYSKEVMRWLREKGRDGDAFRARWLATLAAMAPNGRSDVGVEDG